MRPAQIRVFDGLRITTDHVNHLQGALASGFEDFREVLGLGRPQTGLEVSIADDGTATIQPGTAFDQQKNRLACDTPLTLKVAFGPEDAAKVICLKYEQVEDGAVEGHPTMIWDSCSALVRDTWPDPKENLVTLVKVVKDKDGKLVLHGGRDERDCQRHEAMPEPPGPASPAAAEVGSVPAPAVGVVPPPDAGAAPLTPAAPPVEAESAAHAAPASTPGGVSFRQGLIQLASDSNAGSYLRTVVAPALRAKIATGAIDLTFALGQIDLVPDIVVASFSTHCVLSGDLTFPAADGAPKPQFAFECTSHGEATVTAGGLVQFAASSMDMRPVPAAPGTVWPAADFTGRGLAEFPFAKWADAPDASRPPLAGDVLAGLHLVAQLAPATQGFVFGFKLLWSGTVSENSLKVLETQDIQLTWQINFGWKAVGN